MCNLAYAVGVVIKNGGFPGLGFKAAALKANLPRSSMRYALQAWHHGMAFAVAVGSISDQRVIGMHRQQPVRRLYEDEIRSDYRCASQVQ